MKQCEQRVKIVVAALFLLLVSITPLVYAQQQEAVAFHQKPAPSWSSSDIGVVGKRGSVSMRGTTFTVRGSGKDIWYRSDQFHYVYSVLPGNGQLVAQVLRQDASERWSKAGIMVRETLASNAANVMIALTPYYGITFQRRIASGAQTSHRLTQHRKVPRWIKLVRQNGLITGWESENGLKWTLVNYVALNTRKNVYIGLAVTDHNNSQMSRVIFAHVRLSVNASLPRIPTSIPTPIPTNTPVPLPSSGIQVYGQGNSFISNIQNKGGISASSLAGPIGVALDSHGDLYVADYVNNRVLYYVAGSTTATRVYGQAGSFSTATRNNGGISASSLADPIDVALDSNGNLYVADYGNNRVLYYAAGSTTATRVYGQAGSFSTGTGNNGGISANSLIDPVGVSLDSNGNLYVADYGNNRVLYYAAGSTTATRVYGQAGSFSTAIGNNGGVSARSLAGPTGVSLDSHGNLYVADYVNNRVLYYAAGSTTATRVYGQAGDFSTGTANNGGISASSLDIPMGATLDSNGNLYVADYGNNRVLYYAAGSTTAIWVYGQGGFSTVAGNSGGTSADSLYLPWGIALDSNNYLYVADYNNNRVLIFQQYTAT
jgi:sugar lactone lactonase YvrE